MTGSAEARAGDVPAAEIAFDGLGLEIEGRRILDDVSLGIGAGEILCLLGPSGSGKTTLLRIAAGIERQTTGRVLLNGREVAGPSAFLPPEKRGVGLMFQDFALFPHMTLLDNVRFGLRALSGEQSRHAARTALERVGLAAAADSFPHVLSGGEQQRVALARALAPRPQVLLMDEPFSGLDSRLKDQVRSDTLQILREIGATAVVVTHDAEEAMRMGDRIALLKDGRLVQIGTAEDLYRRPSSLFAAGFFSDVNILPGEVRSGRVVTALGVVADSPLSDGTPMTVALRPTGLGIGMRQTDVPAKVVERRFLGSLDLVTVVAEGSKQPLRARIRPRTLPADRSRVFLSVDLEEVIVFESAKADK